MNRRERRSQRRLTKAEKKAIKTYRAETAELDKLISLLERELDVKRKEKP